MRKCLLFKSISVPDREIEICKIFFIPKNNKVGVSHLISAILFKMLNRIFHITTIAFLDKSSSEEIGGHFITVSILEERYGEEVEEAEDTANCG